MADDRILTEEETDHFMAHCYLDSLEQDLQDCQQLIAGYEIKLRECQTYIKIMERLAMDREGKLAALSEVLEKLEGELALLHLKVGGAHE